MRAHAFLGIFIPTLKKMDYITVRECAAIRRLLQKRLPKTFAFPAGKVAPGVSRQVSAEV